ncbi:MAG: 1-deoxy-D-xylulose-5-phosphate synthase N-terminal domain-containing protein [Elusimicrobiales bacterium]|nr:1-deoxy-D-xylulose-5-phosphate synthase N-terminal domain-containing protein [Elusimicrobiales bacterium]
MPFAEAGLEKLARETRKTLLLLHSRAGTSHIGSAFSSVEILVSLHNGILAKEDVFILSKGHAASALYAVWDSCKIGGAPLDGYCRDGGVLHGHPDRLRCPGVAASTGSLGHGIPIGAGIAFARKRDAKKGRIFVLASDGELQEGSVWEAAASAGRLGLDNLAVIVDANGLQAFEHTENIMPFSTLEPKFLAFGCAVETVDGHDFGQLAKALGAVPFAPGKPSVILAKTVKGKGIKEFEGKLEWHYKSPAAADLERYLLELEET